MRSVCKACGHSQYDGGSHECEKLNRTVYHYDQPQFEDLPDLEPEKEPFNETDESKPVGFDVPPAAEVVEAAP